MARLPQVTEHAIAGSEAAADFGDKYWEERHQLNMRNVSCECVCCNAMVPLPMIHLCPRPPSGPSLPSTLGASDLEYWKIPECVEALRCEREVPL